MSRRSVVIGDEVVGNRSLQRSAHARSIVERRAPSSVALGRSNKTTKKSNKKQIIYSKQEKEPDLMPLSGAQIAAVRSQTSKMVRKRNKNTNSNVRGPPLKEEG